jgi:hypothetical protein
VAGVVAKRRCRRWDGAAQVEFAGHSTNLMPYIVRADLLIVVVAQRLVEKAAKPVISTTLQSFLPNAFDAVGPAMIAARGRHAGHHSSNSLPRTSATRTQSHPTLRAGNIHG